MPKPVVILALLVAAWVLYTQNGGKLPQNALGTGLKSDGRAVPAAPAIVTGGAKDAAKGL
jgi:hypothetical protein